MSSNNGGAAKKSDKGKRKMSGEEPSGGRQTNLFNFRAQPFAASSSIPPTRQIQLNSPSLPTNTHFQFTSPSLPPNSHFSQVQQILNNAAPMKPFSYMSLLTAPDEDEEENIEPLFQDINNQRAQIDHIVTLHSENMRQALGGALGQHLHEVHHEAEERAAKRLKDREAELVAQNARLQSMADHYKAQAERMTIRARTLERTTRMLNERLDEANAARFYAKEEHDEAESSFPDPDRVAPIALECKVCERKRATLMMWPCRHLCVCTRCDGATTYCPVCHNLKTNSIEVFLPLN